MAGEWAGAPLLEAATSEIWQAATTIAICGG
jgi:hypothetical protein